IERDPREEERPGGDRQRQQRMPAERVQQHVGDESPGDDELAMREVDDAQHAVEHVEAAADQRIYRADDEAVGEALQDQQPAHMRLTSGSAAAPASGAAAS